MRIHFGSTRFPAEGAKRLKKAFAAAGGDVGLGMCRELTARFTGYKDWHELSAVVGRHRVDPMDWEVDDATFKARGEQFIAKLMECGIDRDTASFIIDLAGPTGEGARNQELRQAMDAWKGPLRWTLRRDGPGYVVVAGDRKSELRRKMGWDSPRPDTASDPGSEGPAP
jgi:hypothetical protein